jgi:hypothetical protein
VSNIALPQTQVWEIVTVTGMGTILLSGTAAPGPHNSFYSAFSSATGTVFYSITDTVNNQWERGVGTFSGTSSPGTLSRVTILASSSSNSVVNFSGHTCYITTLSSAAAPYGGDSPYIEFFGGSTEHNFDNTLAIMSAISQGYPVRFGPGTYYVAGGLVISSNAVFIGIRGATTVKRLSQTAYQSWIDFIGSTVDVDGILFDHNSSITTPSYGVVVDATVTTSFIANSQFINNKSSPALSGGLIYNSTAASSTVISHTIQSCVFSGNNNSGLYIANVNDVSILDCISYGNTGNGIGVLGDPLNLNPSNRIEIRGCLTYNNNGNGIFLNQVMNGTLEEYSALQPATVGAQVISNKSHNNGAYGIYVGTVKNALIQGNICHNNGQIYTSAAEILGDCAYFTEFSDNVLYGTTCAFGIDAAGGYYCAFNNNIITGSFAYALNIGGSTGNSATANRISNFVGVGINIEQIEGSAGSISFGVVASNLMLTNNIIDYSSGRNAIYLADNPSATLVMENKFINASDQAGLSAVFDLSSSAVYLNNSINGLTIPTISVSGSNVIVPDWAECVNLTASSSPPSVVSIQTNAQNCVGTGIGYITLPNGGSGTGYPSASSDLGVTVSVTSGQGSGVTATATLSVSGFAGGSHGAGYTSAPTVSISGPGGGGTAATASTLLWLSGFSNIVGGTGYASTTTVSFSGGGGGVGAAATVTVSNGVIVGLTVTNSGLSYTSAPTVAFSNTGGGTGASATATMSVQQLLLGSGGTGYTSVPTVSLSGGGGTGATATAGMSISGLNLLSGGSGYTSGAAVTISGTGNNVVAATATATVSAGVVTGLHLLSGGSGYIPGIDIIIAGFGCQVPATAAAVVSAGAITALTLLSGGLGFTSGGTATISGYGSQVAATAMITLSLASLSVVNGGSGYTIGTTTVSLSGGGGGSGATARPTIVNGVITGLNVTNGGSGYTSIPNIIISSTSGGVGATASATMSVPVTLSVVSLSVVNGGSGYTIGTTTVLLSGGGGGGATAIPTIVNGVITGLNVTNGGLGYTSIPNITISSTNGGIGATASATMSVPGLALISGGSGYQYGITVTISGSGSGFGSPTPPSTEVYNQAGNIIGFRVGARGAGYVSTNLAASISPATTQATATATVGIPWTPNRKISLVNIGSSILTLIGATSPSSSSFVSPTGTNYSLYPQQSTSVIYQSNFGYISDNSRGISTAITFNNGQFSLNGGQFAGMRNRIINGGMAVDQRNNGSQQTITPPNSDIFTVDRWCAVSWGAVTTGQRIAGSTSAQYLYQITGASGNTSLNLSQYIEAANCYDLAGQFITISFDMANSLLSFVDVQVCYASATDNWGIAPVVVGTLSVTITPTVTRYSVTFQLPTAANTGLQVLFFQGAQTSGTWTIGNVQLELGTVATPFEQRLYSSELALCQRYYYRNTGTGTDMVPLSGSGSSYIWNFTFPTQMRAAPTVTKNLTASNFAGANNPSSGQWGVAIAGGVALGTASGTPAINGGGITVNGMSWMCIGAAFTSTPNTLSFNGLYFDASAELF